MLLFIHRGELSGITLADEMRVASSPIMDFVASRGLQIDWCEAAGDEYFLDCAASVVLKI